MDRRMGREALGGREKQGSDEMRGKILFGHVIYDVTDHGKVGVAIQRTQYHWVVRAADGRRRFIEHQNARRGTPAALANLNQRQRKTG